MTVVTLGGANRLRDSSSTRLRAGMPGNRVSKVNHPSGNDLSAQAAFVLQSVTDLGKGDFREMIAGLAQPYPTEHHLSNQELTTHEGVQIDALRHKISTGILGRKWASATPRERLDLFPFNECHFEVGPSRVR